MQRPLYNHITVFYHLMVKSLAVLFKLKICERIKTAKFIRIQENIPSLSFWSQEITIKVSTNNGRCKSSDSCHKFLYPCIWPYRHCQTNSNVWNFPGIEMTEKSKFELIIYSNLSHLLTGNYSYRFDWSVQANFRGIWLEHWSKFSNNF